MVERDGLDRLVPDGHQGVALRAGHFDYAATSIGKDAPDPTSLILALDGLEDPRNVGSLLRTAEAMGVVEIVLPADRAAQITPAVVNASAGAVEHLAIVQETNLARWLDRAKQAGYWVAGLAADAEAIPLIGASLPAPLVLVVGSEGSGLRRLTQERCDLILSIPMYGQVGSLNAAVAGSVAVCVARSALGMSNAANQ